MNNNISTRQPKIRRNAQDIIEPQNKNRRKRQVITNYLF
jgi:hypothetical protein